MDTNQTTTRQRQTKYCEAIEHVLQIKGHATNAELWTSLQGIFPNVSATTIHRATARLAERGKIGIAPAASDRSMRYDTNATPHDHFICTSCDLIRDTDVKDQIVPLLESAIDGCSISGRLSITGICKQCSMENIL